MFRFAIATLCAVALMATAAEAGKRQQLLGNGSHGGVPRAVYVEPTPAPLAYAPAPQPQPMVSRTVTLPDQVVKEWVQVERVIPGKTIEVTEPAPLAAFTAPCAPMGPLAVLAPECRERERRRQARLDRRAQRKSLGIEEPLQTADLPADANQPTPAE